MGSLVSARLLPCRACIGRFIIPGSRYLDSVTDPAFGLRHLKRRPSRSSPLVIVLHNTALPPPRCIGSWLLTVLAGSFFGPNSSSPTTHSRTQSLDPSSIALHNILALKAQLLDEFTHRSTRLPSKELQTTVERPPVTLFCDLRSVSALYPISGFSSCIGTSSSPAIERKRLPAHRSNIRDLYEVHHRFSPAIARIDICATARDWREGPASHL